MAFVRLAKHRPRARPVGLAAFALFFLDLSFRNVANPEAILNAGWTVQRILVGRVAQKQLIPWGKPRGVKASFDSRTRSNSRPRPRPRRAGIRLPGIGKSVANCVYRLLKRFFSHRGIHWGKVIGSGRGGTRRTMPVR